MSTEIEAKREREREIQEARWGGRERDLVQFDFMMMAETQKKKKMGRANFFLLSIPCISTHGQGERRRERKKDGRT